MDNERPPTSRVFIVDDDSSIRKSLTRLFQLEGFRVESFDSGRRFLSSVPADAEGCLVLDIYMPDMDGFALFQKTKELGYRQPVIFVSAHAKEGDREYALNQGAAGFLQKPFDDDSLVALVRKALEAGQVS